MYNDAATAAEQFPVVANRTKDSMTLAEARKVALATAADWVNGADWDQFWGEDVAIAAFNNDELSRVLARAQREVSNAIRRIRRVG